MAQGPRPITASCTSSDPDTCPPVDSADGCATAEVGASGEVGVGDRCYPCLRPSILSEESAVKSVSPGPTLLVTKPKAGFRARAASRLPKVDGQSGPERAVRMSCQLSRSASRGILRTTEELRSVWSDNETSIDLLGFQHLKGAVCAIVKNGSLLPATVGIYGDWGSGKSSLIQMVQEEFEKEEGILVLPFNGWLFEGYEDAKTALTGTVLEELLSHRKFLAKADDAVKRFGRRLLQRANLLKVASALGKFALAAKTAGIGPLLLGLSGSKDVVEVGKELLEEGKEVEPGNLVEFIKEKNKGEELEEGEYSIRKSVREFRKDFDELLRRSRIETLVIVIDDLDRCLPDSIIETLEAIKLFLFVKRTAFIIGADEELVRYAVRKRFPEFPGDRREVGTAYLEKLIQFPIRVPPLGRSEVEAYISLLFASISGMSEDRLSIAREFVTKGTPGDLISPSFNLTVAQKAFPDLDPALVERLALAQRISPILGTGMNGNPRQCKRFLNTLLMRLDMGKSRGVALSQRVLAKLMLLEYFKPEMFKQLAGAQAAQSGKPQELARLERIVLGKAAEAVVVLESEPKTTDSTPDGKPRKAQVRKDSSAELDLPADFHLWLTDPWTHDWLASEPALANTDLRVYFFFSRDVLGVLGSIIQRLSAPAQQIVQKLLSESEAVRGNAIKDGERLSPAEAASIFEALASRAREEEDLSRDNSALSALLKWTGAHSELWSQLVALLTSLPRKGLPINTPTQLVLLSRNSEAEQAIKQLLDTWSKNTVNTGLAKSAQNALTRLMGKK